MKDNSLNVETNEPPGFYSEYRSPVLTTSDYVFYALAAELVCLARARTRLGRAGRVTGSTFSNRPVNFNIGNGNKPLL